METASDLADALEIRQRVRDYVHYLKRLDQSVPRAPGTPSRIDQLRAVLQQKTGGADTRKGDDDDRLEVREPVAGTAVPVESLSFQLPSSSSLERLRGQELFCTHPYEDDAFVRLGRFV